MFKNSSGLSPEQGAMYLEIVDASLRVTRREHFFPWLQGCFQYLLPHEIMVCGIDAAGSAGFRFESYSSIRYFTERHAEEATSPDEGLIWRVMKSWREARRPVMLGHGMPAGDYGNFVVPFNEPAESLDQSELRNIAAHGMCSDDGGVSTFFCFSRLSGQPGGSYAYLLELLMPHLHSAVVRTNRQQADSIRLNPAAVEPAERQVTDREVEVLHWLNMGKTNWEIAQILEISPLTVKNHVQNILRKLNVQSRGHAALKASRIGLIRN
jgi:transcriptional regulator EpsA